MQRFKNVLVCVDDDAHADLALERGAALASRAEARLTILEVTPAAPAGCRSHAPRLGSLRRERLERLAMPLRGQSIPVAVDAGARGGEPVAAIIREVLGSRHDLVVRVDHDRPRLFRATPTLQLARLCPCPLWVIQPPGVPGRDHLLAAVNLCESDEALDQAIVENALVLARLLDRRLHVVHAWEAPGVHLLAPRTCAEDLARYADGIKRWHQEQLDRLMRRYAAVIPRERIHLRKGWPIDVIPRLAAELAAEPIVMGTNARRGLAGVLIGNTAERVMRRTERSVILVKAASFVSPASLPARSTRPRDAGVGTWPRPRQRTARCVLAGR